MNKISRASALLIFMTAPKLIINTVANYVAYKYIGVYTNAKFDNYDSSDCINR